MPVTVDEWPICHTPGCDNEVDPRRVALLDGVVRCMKCPCPAPPIFVIDVPKSNPLVTRDLTFAKGVGSSHKGNRQVF